jgi:hypothetical protein
VNQKRREQIEAAMMRHPSTYHARQQHPDPIDTAQEFHIDRNGRSGRVDPPHHTHGDKWEIEDPEHTPWYLSYSRPRKAKLFDALSVVLLAALIAAAITLEWLIVTGVWPR